MVKELQKKFTFAAMAAVTILLLTLVGAINLIHLATVAGQQKKMLEILCEADGNPAERFARNAFYMEKASGNSENNQEDHADRGISRDRDQAGTGTGQQNRFKQGGRKQDSQYPMQQDLDMAEKGLPPERQGWPEPGRSGLFNRRITVDDTMSARFFSVWLDDEGQIEGTNTAQIYAVTEEGALEMAQEILALKKKSGRIRGFRYLLTKRGGQQESSSDSASVAASAGGWDDLSADSSETGTEELSGSEMLLVVMDVSGDDQNLLLVLGISSVIAALCWAVMLLPVHILAKRAIAPTALSIERQKQFVTNAGHELKTPLAIILANTEALELFNGESKWTRNIRAQTVRLSGLMQNLLTLSRMDENALRLERKPFDLDGLAHEVWENFAQSAAARSLTVDFSSVGTEHITALGDRESVSQLLSILFDNAVKYAPRGGRISIRTFAEGKEVVLTQTNTLPGEEKGKEGQSRIPEDPERLFERFYRADEDRSRKKGGFGIGLSAARAIASANSGTIRADTGPGEISFTFRLPGARGED